MEPRRISICKIPARRAISCGNVEEASSEFQLGTTSVVITFRITLENDAFSRFVNSNLFNGNKICGAEVIAGKRLNAI